MCNQQGPLITTYPLKQTGATCLTLWNRLLKRMFHGVHNWGTLHKEKVLVNLPGNYPWHRAIKGIIYESHKGPLFIHSTPISLKAFSFKMLDSICGWKTMFYRDQILSEQLYIKHCTTDEVHEKWNWVKVRNKTKSETFSCNISWFVLSHCHVVDLHDNLTFQVHTFKAFNARQILKICWYTKYCYLFVHK